MMSATPLSAAPLNAIPLSVNMVKILQKFKFDTDGHAIK